MKIKSFIKKCIASLLVASSILTAIPATAYADGIGSNANGNNSSSARTGGGGDFGVNLPAGRIGLRFSIVDGDDPSKVISQRVIDYWFMTEANFEKYTTGGTATKVTNPGGGYYKGVKTQRYDTPNSMVTITLDSEKYSKFPLNTLKADPESWAYHDGAFHSRGEKYVEWLDKDASGKSTGGNITEYMKGYLKEKAYYVKPTEAAVENGICDEYKITVMRTGDNSVRITNIRPSSNNGLSRAVHHGSGATISADLSGDEIVNKIFSTVYGNNGSNSNIPQEVVAMAAGEAIGMFKNMTDDAREEALKLADAKSNSTKASETYNYLAKNYGVEINEALKKVVGTGAATGKAVDVITDTVQKFTDSKEKGDTNKEEVETMTESDYQAKLDSRPPILQILDYTPDGEDKPLLWFDGLEMQTYKITQADGSIREEKRPDWLNCDKKWILLVEPLFMLTIFGDTDDANHIILCKQVGTITNIAEAIKEKARNTPAYNSTNWYNWKALNQSLWSALSVKFGKDEMNGDIKGDILPVYKDDGTVDEKRSPKNPFTSLKVSPQDTRTFKSMNDYGAHEEGYGVCLWWAGSIGKNKHNPDTPDFGYHIPGVDDDADYNIISFYEDTSGKTVKGRVDQLNVPRDTIVSTDGLKEWKITKEPPTNALKFNETPSGRSGSGTPPAPNADENTLYLLYEIDDNVIKLHQDELAHTYKMSDLRGLVHTHNDI